MPNGSSDDAIDKIWNDFDQGGENSIVVFMEKSKSSFIEIQRAIKSLPCPGHEKLILANATNIQKVKAEIKTASDKFKGGLWTLLKIIGILVFLVNAIVGPYIVVKMVEESKNIQGENK